MKIIAILAGSFLLTGLAHAAEVQCAIPYSAEAVILVQYQVDAQGKPLSNARVQFFDQNGFSITARLEITKSEIVPQDFILFSAKNEDGDLSFEAKFDPRRDAYAGLAN